MAGMPRNLPVRDEQRLQAAVARGALTPARAEHWRVYAAAGHDIAFIDQLVGGVVLPASGRVVAAAAPRDANAGYHGLFGQTEPEEDSPEYTALYGSAERGRQVADTREVAAKAAVAALTDDQVYTALFGEVSAAAVPVVASAAGPAGQHGQGEARPRQYRVRAPHVSLRVPQSPNGVAAGADPAKTTWRTIELRGGDRVPEDAHPDDLERLLHQKTRLGPMIKPW
jgi:hypothetical protein